MKNEIKKILEIGSTVKASYKSAINDWFSEISISKIKQTWDDGKTYYFISPYCEKFYNIDDAVYKFISYAYTSKNYGYIQQRLINKGVDFENEYDLENPNEKVKKLFEDEGKIVDQEYQDLLPKPLKFKERVYYIKEGIHYVGKPVNIRGVVVQATTLDDLKIKMKSLCKIVLEHHFDILDNDDPFELVEEKDPSVWLYGEKDAEIRNELQKYKDLFGDI